MMVIRVQMEQVKLEGLISDDMKFTKDSSSTY